MRLREAVETVHQRAQATAAFQASCGVRRAAQVKIYDDFLLMLDGWLRPYVAEEKIQTHRGEVKIMDAELGELTVACLSIRPLPNTGIDVTVSPTGTCCANIRNEIRLKRADTLSRAEEYFIYQLASEGERVAWQIARRSRNAGRPKPLLQDTFEEAVCALFLA